MKEPIYGVLNSFWDEEPLHLSLIDLSDDFSSTEALTVNNALDTIQIIINNNSKEDLTISIKKLLESGNWRCHLVVVATLIIDPTFRTEELFNIIRSRVRVGSWANPHLLVLLKAYDDQFPQNLMDILVDSFRIKGYINLNDKNKKGSVPLIIEGTEELKSAMNWLIGNKVSKNNQGLVLAKSWEIRLKEIEHFLNTQNNT